MTRRQTRSPRGNAAHRMLLDSMDNAVRQIQGKTSDEGVHDARKSLKKARAALRLLREVLGDRRYQKENAALRDAGRMLSPLRDAKVLIDALEALKERYADELEGLGFTHLHDDLRSELDRIRASLRRDDSAVLKRCVAAIRAARRRAASWRLKPDPDATLEGLRKLYRKARKAEAAAISGGESAAFHELRKQVKYLFNATAPLQESGDGALSKARDRADQLADELGDDHDLAVLCERALRRPGAEKPEAIEALAALVRKRRAKLQKRAIRLGEKLFDRKPRKFVAEVSSDSRRPPADASSGTVAGRPSPRPRPRPGGC